jgi:hypothetical protein
MKKKARHIEAHPSGPEQDAFQITYEWGNSRRTLNTAPKATSKEQPPHGAGSFHDPEHHFMLLERVEALLRSSC